MGVPLPVEAKLDERSAIAAADRAQRVFADAGKDAGKSFSDSFTTGAQGAEQAVKKMGDRAKDAYDKATDAAGKLRSEEARLQELRDKQANNSQIVSAAERVEKARRAEVRAIRDATNAMQEYEQASESAGRNSGNSFLGGLQGAVGGAAASGQDMASEFASGFAGASVLTRLGAAGGPIGLALAGVATIGFAGGKLLAGGIADGMATLQLQDLVQSRMGIDDGTMARFGAAAGAAYADGWGATLEDNLRTVQFGVQGGLIDEGATDNQMQRYVSQMQTVSTLMEEDSQSIARGVRNFVKTGMVASTEEALDLLTVATQKGLNISSDLLDTFEEYGTKFRDVGINGAEALGLIDQMWKGGARNVDVAADALKEFAITVVDDSDTTKAAMTALGFSADDMAKRFAEGGPSAKAAFGAVLEALASIKDPMEQERIGLNLFKTKWEDVGDAIKNVDLPSAATELGTIKGATDTASDGLSRHADGWDQLGRSIDTTFSKFKAWLADTDIGRFLNQTIPGALNNFLDTSDPMADFRDSLPADGFAAPAAGDGLLGDAPVMGPVPGGWGSIPTPAFAPGAGTFVDPRINASAPTLPGMSPPGPGEPDGGPARGSGMSLADAEQSVKDEKDGEKPRTVIDPSLFSLDAVPIGSMPGAGQQQPPGMLPRPGVAQPQGVPTWNPEQQAYGSMVVDPQRVFDAETSLISQRQSVESARERLLVMEAEGTATAAELNAARTSVITTERAYISNQQKLLEAQQGTWKKANDVISGAMGDLKSVFAPLDEDFGISGGIPGIVENLTKLFGNMALAGVIGSSPTLQGAALELANGTGGAGLFGIGGKGATPSVMGPAAWQPAMAGANSNVNAMMTLAQQSSGNVKYAPASDLVNGLADCSGSISDLVEMLQTGQTNPGRLFTTTNFASDEEAAKLGFRPGNMPGALNVGVNPYPGQSGHMAATLPNGVNFEGGGGTGGGAQYGQGAAGAQDSQFEKQYYLPVGGGVSTIPSYAPAASPGYSTPSLYGPENTNPALTAGLPTIPAGAGGQGYMGLGGPPAIGGPGGVPPQTSGGGNGGIGVDGMAMDAIMAGTSALDVMAPGAGQAAKVGIQLANRAIKYGSQVAGIGASGLMETFLPSGSPLGNFGNSWIGKLAGGIAGAKPALPNTAAKQSAPPNPNAQQGQQGAGTQVGTHIEKLEFNNNEATQGSGVNDLERNLTATNAPSGGVR